MFVATLLALCYPLQQLGSEGSGDLRSREIKGRPAVVCALKNTSVRANIAGLGAEVRVVQTFVNPSRETIEAVYTFPLPHDAAIDRMRMKVGSQVIEGRINRKEIARRIYEAAKHAGQTAALLDQERPNIFTQSVANITPGAEVKVEINYVQLLKYEKGQFEFSYPMVVGPRFLGNVKEPAGTGGQTAKDGLIGPGGDQRTNAQKIDPPRVAPGTRSGADIDLQVRINGLKPRAMQSPLHQVATEAGEDGTVIRLARRNEIPNRDFILKYESAGEGITSSFVTTYDKYLGGFFSLILLPPKVPKSDQIAPREVVFVMDQSGSQSGFPIAKSKELTLKMMKTLRRGDTFNVFGFNNTVQSCFERPMLATPDSLAKAQSFVQGMEANGGTQLLEGMNAALKFHKDPKRLRIVLFNTDGFVGDEPEILDAIQKNRDTTRIFTFGIGNGVNRFLIDSMSREGRGASEVVTLQDKADGVVQRLIDRAYSPVLTDIKVDLPGATDFTPEAIPDVFNDRPIVVFGRFATPGSGTLKVSGRLGGEPWNVSMPVTLGAAEGSRAVSSLWARNRIEDLQSKSYLAMVNGSPDDPIVNAITDVALEHGLMSQYTSFVAVSPRVVNVGGRQRTVYVPVERADGLTFDQGGNMAEERPAMMGGGGFGGGGGSFAGAAGPGGATFASKAVSTGTVRMKAENRRGSSADRAVTEADKKRFNFERKVASSLRSAKGRVEVMVWVTSITPAILASLKEAGMDVDTSMKDLRVVLGTCDAATLRKLAELAVVEAIDPLSG